MLNAHMSHYDINAICMGVDIAIHKQNMSVWVPSRLVNYFWDKGLKDYVTLDLGVYYDILFFDQHILSKIFR
jgi:hypothetical protein